MSSPLFNLFNQNNPMQMINDFQNFKRNFQGNPRQEVERMLQSGQITQQQLNQAQGMAQKFQAILNAFH